MVAEAGPPAATEDGQLILLHLLLASYAHDLPETEDMLGLKREPETFTPCHICFAKRQSFSTQRKRGASNLTTYVSHFEQHEKIGNINAAEDCIRTLSLDPVLTTLNSFLFIGTIQGSSCM